MLSLIGAGDVPQAAAELQHLRRLAPELVAVRLSGVWLATDPKVRQREVDFLNAANVQTQAAPEAAANAGLV